MIITFLFKAKRKVVRSIRLSIQKFKIFEIKKLYPQKFFYDGQPAIGKDFSVFFDISNATVTLGKNVSFRDYCQLRSLSGGKITIADNVFFNNNCSLNCMQEISIGKDCQFGENVRFYDHNHVYSDQSKNVADQGYSTGRIVVGNNCWFGTNVIVLKNVTIGDNVVIGAGCIIYRSVPSNSVIVNKQELLLKQTNSTNIK